MNENTTHEIDSIKPINVNTVHKICSGQVVFSLAIAVKELVENSLDAGATIIEVRLKNYGIDLIEVSDNGTGVTEDNFAALTLKYHTSKLSDYSDLIEVSSFGFRGEALSSLCSLADLIITTRHINSQYATKIVYDHKGNITSTTPCSRQVGTTVTLTNLFCSLPVRQKEFHKNAKREFNKMTSLLYAYCLISSGVKITCSNQTNSGSKNVIVATQGSVSYKDNIACVFGLKQLKNILEIKTESTCNIKDNILRGLSGEVQESDESVAIEDIDIDLSEDSNDTNDVVNTQENIELSQKSQGHKNVTDPVKLTGFISSCTHGSGRSSADRQFFYINCRPCEPNKIIKLVNETYRQYNPNQYPFIFLNIDMERISVDVNVTPDKRQLFLTKEKAVLDVVKASLLKVFESIPRTLKLEQLDNNQENLKTHEVLPELSQPRIFNSFIKQFSNKSESIAVTNKIGHKNVDLKRKSTTLIDSYVTAKKSHTKDTDNLENTITPEITDDARAIKNEISDNKNELIEIHDTNNTKNTIFLGYTDLPDTQIRNVSDVVTEISHKVYCTPNNLKKQTKPKLHKVITDKEDIGKCKRRVVNFKTSIEHVKSLVNIYNERKNSNKPDRVKFRTVINPVFNKKCEEELSREITKDSFKEMVVIGQFNLGFIITRLQDDLFIIDQHATDEIYNFETLQKTTELTTQKLVIPQALELTGVNEQVLMDNLDIFKKNGFTFEINENALPTKRVKLLSLPMSKNWIFGKDDIEELLFMIRENQYEHCRPSRVRDMFASRACRKSVMIGTALTKTDMKKLVDHMAEIDKPWNCPHGRPTIRHLVNLAMVHTKDN